MAWNSTTQIMTAPLNINANGDIQKATGLAGHGDLGDCIVNGAINKWAKFKPVRSSKITPVTASELASLNYGLSLTKYTSITDLISGVTAKTDWAYLRPRNNGEDWFRFFDFTNPDNITSTGYRGDANCFLGSVDATGIYTQGSGGTVIRANINTGNNLKAGSVGIADLTDIDGDSLSLGDLYLGVLLKKSTYAYKTSSVTIGSQTHTVELTLTASEADALSTGAWEMYIFLAAKICRSVVTTATTINRTYLSYGAFALPGIGKRSLTVQSAATTASCSIRDDQLTITLGAGRYWVGFDIAYLASSSSVYIYASYEIYGGSEYGAKTDLIGSSSQEITLQCTSTTQYYSVNYLIRDGWPLYVTVVLKYRIGTSQTVYTAPEVSARTEEE